MTTPPPHDSLGDAIRALRTARGLGLRGLARDAGVSFSHVSTIEQGRAVPSPDVLRRLADVLRADPADLVLCRADDPVAALGMLAAVSAPWARALGRVFADAGHERLTPAELEDLLDRRRGGRLDERRRVGADHALD